MLGAILSKVGIKGGVILALVLLVLAQTVRIEGFMFIEGFKEAKDRLSRDLANVSQKQKEAELALKEQNTSWENKYLKMSMELQQNAQSNLTDALISTGDYKRVNSLQGANLERICKQAVAAAKGGSTPNPVGASQTPLLVAAQARDIDVCTENTIKAETGHDLAKAIKALHAE